MTRTVLLLAATGTLVACLDTAAAPGSPPGPDRPPTASEQAGISAQFGVPAPPDVCELLPPDGPCALACDPAALAEQYVPVGACAAFACTLTDGRMITVSACHFPEGP